MKSADCLLYLLTLNTVQQVATPKITINIIRFDKKGKKKWMVIKMLLVLLRSFNVYMIA